MGKLFSVKIFLGMLFVAWLSTAACAQKNPAAPDNETRTPAPVRSLYSIDGDWTVPMCPSHFHDSLSTNGIAGPHDRDVTPATVSKSVPAAITQQAIAASGKTHIGNYIVIVNVVVNTKGLPTKLCLQKSSGYGLDAAAATAVPEYRFNPAKRNGKPVPIRVPVEVRFENPEIGMGAKAGFGRPAE